MQDKSFLFTLVGTDIYRLKNTEIFFIRNILYAILIAKINLKMKFDIDVQSLRFVVANVLDCVIVISEFEHQSRHCVSNSDYPWRRCKLCYPFSNALKSNILFFHNDTFGIKITQEGLFAIKATKKKMTTKNKRNKN